MYHPFANAIALVLILVGPLAGAAQEAMAPTDPTSTECVAPPLPPGTPTPFDATPAGSHTATEATPEPLPTGAGMPTDGALLTRLHAADVNLVNCMNAQDWLAVAALMTPRALLAEQWGGVTNPYDLPAKAEALGVPWVEILAVGNAQTHADGRVSNEIVATYDHGQPVRGRDFWVERDGWLIFDELVFIELVPAGTPVAGTPPP